MISIPVLVILALGAYRATRLVVVDSLFDGTRSRFHVFLANKKSFIAAKALEGTSCTWCVSCHVSWLLYAGYMHSYPWDFGINGWINVAAIAGLGGMLHAFEPDED